MTRPGPSLVPSSAPPLSAGRMLGEKFEIVGVLGEGGTGIVYDARRVAEDDRVALKVIHSHLAGDKQIRGRFTREANILRRLDGKHLCPLLDFGELPDPRRPDSGLLYMVLPKIEGIALDALLAKERLLPQERALDIVTQVCEGLKEAHSQGVIHRDLKPGNVLLRGGERVVVVDFGMAKIMTGGGTGTTNLTQHNMVFGTPEYMAPEQARGDELDARCDVYAAGIILYELLTGRVPFTGMTPLNVLTAHLTSQPKRPRESAPPGREITPALEAVVLHAIEKDPAKRYATAAALAAAIAKATEAPDDAEAVAPSRRAVSLRVDESGADAHALTMPAPEPPPQRHVITVRPPDGAAAGSMRPGAVTSVPPTRKSPHAEASHLWTIVWIVAAALGIAIGVWLSLRGG